MEELNQQENKSPVKKAIIPIALLALLFALFHYKDSVLNFFDNKHTDSLAEVTAFKNDVRRKDSKSIDFKNTQQNEKIYHGDSLSTGSNSNALVTFKSGQLLNVDQNSLIIFDDLTDTPEFVRGNVKVTVKGKMKLKVDNEIIEIDGGNKVSDVQIFKDEKAKVQKIVLLKGEAKIQSPAKKEVVYLKPNIPVAPKQIIKADAFLADVNREPTNVQPGQPAPVVLGRPPMQVAQQTGYYKLYDYYSRMLSSKTELGRNKGFAQKPNFHFENHTPSTVSITPQKSESEDPSQNPYTIRVIDPVNPAGYVFEVSQDENFTEGQTQYFWKNSYFTQNFPAPGNYYIRYRKVLNGQVLTEYSPTEKVFVNEKPKPVVVVKPEPAPVVQAPKPVKKIEPVKKTQIVAMKPQPAPVIKKVEPEIVERKPTAVPETKIETQEMQSNIKTEPAAILRNQNYVLSNVGVSAGQAFLVSGQQLANQNQINTSYGLQISGLHWFNQNGFRASYAKGVTSNDSNNLVSQAEIDYLHRFSKAAGFTNGGSFQYYVSLGLESYTNNNSTSNFVDSYNMYKLGLGASLPVFSFWTIDGQFAYGVGDSHKSGIYLSTRANYFITQKVSLGIGWRARKFEYYLIDQKNYESLSEIYTTLNMYY